MSGGVGPTANDIRLPPDNYDHDDTSALPGHTPRLRFLSFRQLNVLAASTILAVSGMVPAGDIAFALCFLPYIYFLSRFAFPTLRPSDSPDPPVFGERNRLLSVYVSVGALLGLLLPIAYIIEGVAEGDKKGIQAAAPHVFLLASQVFAEGVSFSPQFSLPARAFVPVFYNAWRILAIADWLRDEIAKEVAAGGELRIIVGLGLAVANMVFWGFNLFGFLLPVYLPRALSRHYGYKEKK